MKSVLHFMLRGVAQYATCVASSLVEGIVSILFMLVGDLVRSGVLKRLKGICPSTTLFAWARAESANL